LRSDDLATAATFRDLADAQVARMTLEAAGVECRLLDEELIRIDWALSTAFGGMKLVVRSEDVEVARQLLAEVETAGESAGAVPEELAGGESCPRCGSASVATVNLTRKPGLAAALLGVPVFAAAERLRCEACGHVWRGDGGD
jgi:hypothetical protein